MPNRLAGATSPYLLQHADNPVDWWEWSDAAFEEAARRDVPVLLSVGYAACHWCHVMAHESFEDPATAEQINAGLRRRQGRPRGAARHRRGLHGGHPGDDRAGRLADDLLPHPGGGALPLRHLLPDGALPAALLDAVTQAWRDDGARVRSAAGQIAARLADNAAARLPPAGLDAEALDAAVPRWPASSTR